MIMEKENTHTVPELSLSNIKYAFFTNEAGESDAGYLVNGLKTRNVYIHGSKQASDNSPDKLPDSPNNILANIEQCFDELGAESHRTYKFYMDSYYANMGRSDPLIIACDDLDYLQTLKKQAHDNIDFEDLDKTNPNYLGLESNMRTALKNSDVSVIRADALIFKAIPGESIAVLGGSADAHPIMMFDDEHKIACYISGAHHALKQGVLEHSFNKMRDLGANVKNIRLVKQTSLSI